QAAAGVGDGEVERAVRLEQLMGDVERSAGVREVLEHVAQHDEAERARLEPVVLDVGGARVEATLACTRRRPGRRLDAGRLPPALLRRHEEGSRPAPEVGDAARAYDALDLDQRTSRGLDLSRHP